MRPSTTAAFTIALVVFGSIAAAQGNQTLAKEAYDRGAVAHARGDFKRAAEQFARADALAPSPIALQAALDAAVDADDPVLGAELLERSRRDTPAGALVASIDAATKKFAGRVGHVKIACPSDARCTSKLDGAAFEPSKGVWTPIGPHTLAVDLDGSTDTRTVTVHAGEHLEVAPARTAAQPATALATAPATGTVVPDDARPAPAEVRAKPLPPFVFFVGAGVTVVLAGAATFFGVTAKGKHDDFVGAGCDRVATSSCQDLKDDGENAQRIANIGFAATAVAGVATVAIGVFFTDWARAAKAGRAPVIVPTSGGIGAGYSVRF